MKKRVIIFDLDDTLVNTYKNECSRASTAYFLLTGCDFSESEFRSIYGKPNFSSNISEILGSLNEELFFSLFDTLLIEQPYKALVQEEDLQKLHKGGLIIGIVTNSRRDKSVIKLKSIAFKKWDFIYTVEDLMLPKPESRIVNEICSRFDVTTEACVIIGDSTIDKVFAEINHTTFLGVNTGITIWEEGVVAFDTIKDCVSYLI